MANRFRQREAVGKAGWNPALAGKPQTIDDLKFANYFKEVFLDSDTKVACISGSASEEPRDWFLTNQMKFDARANVNKKAGSKRMFSHAIMTPGWPGWLDKVDEEMATLKPDSWKGYTIGDNTNKHLAKHPYRLDDEKLMYPFYERLVKWSKDHSGVVNVCIHKGLFPPQVETSSPIYWGTAPWRTWVKRQKIGRSLTLLFITPATASPAAVRWSRPGNSYNAPAVLNGSAISPISPRSMA